MLVRDIMTTKFQLVAPDTSLGEAAKLMRDGDFGYLPVGEDDRLKGAVTDRDIVIRGLAEGRGPNATVAEVLSEQIVYCFEDDEINEAADIMKLEQIRRLAVLNSDKRLVGIISLGDIARITEDKRLTGDIETQVAQPN
ncbi:CBS domain pair family protein [Asticcacaulis biprosthecium C19]|uniref:CBS domain pair family protein n=1 Tax=Asticcacaulis biprosthecium C19 TaxID=715226 RepID=F4QLM4_9CAUL|nr:CBS domain-containing protein [Asticcacaulis biprosthecium]EGF93522.1 CBS domain pair family protein [Asticcacaulis biprosthecium C19]